MRTAQILCISVMHWSQIWCVWHPVSMPEMHACVHTLCNTYNGAYTEFLMKDNTRRCFRSHVWCLFIIHDGFFSHVCVFKLLPCNSWCINKLHIIVQIFNRQTVWLQWSSLITWGLSTISFPFRGGHLHAPAIKLWGLAFASPDVILCGWLCSKHQLTN